MGASQSKQQETPQSKVFLPKTPTEFSNSLVGKLDSSVESDYTRTQYTEKHIQDEVANELRKIEQESAKALKEAFNKLPESESNNNNNTNTDGNSLRQKLDELKSKLDSRPAPQQLGKEISNTREQLVKCFKDNKDKPLNCWDEVQKFKESVQNL